MTSSQRITGIRAQRKHLIFFLAVLITLPLTGRAVDEILLKSGKRISGTIVAQSKDRVVMQVGEGSVVYPKRAIRRIYDGITSNPPIVELPAGNELPPWWIPLADLYAEDWITTVENIPATPIDGGSFKNVPYLSFRGNSDYELNIYGDPENPAAIEIGHYSRSSPSRDVLTHCREFLVSYLTDLEQIETLYELDARGGSQSVAGLTIQVTPPSKAEAYGGWWLLVYNPRLIAAARKDSVSGFREASTGYLDLVKASTDDVTSWRKWEITDALERLIPMEKIEVR